MSEEKTREEEIQEDGLDRMEETPEGEAADTSDSDRAEVESPQSFVREKIKKQPFYKRRYVRRLCRQLLVAVLCGAVACFVFVKLYPWMDDTFGREEPSEITIPDDEEMPEEEDASDTDGGEEEPEAVEEEEVQEPESTEEEEAVEEEETEPLEFTSEEYGNLYDSLDDVVDAASYCLVTVTASESGTDWFSAAYGDVQEISGILAGNNGVELLILVPYSSVSGMSELSAEFVDGSEHEAVLKTYDMISDLAILSVNLSDVTSDTLSVIQMAELGSSRYLKAGEPVIAVGSPAGTAGSVKYGNLVADSSTISVIDGEYSLLITDITASDNASGVLLNMDGQVIGLIEDGYLDSNNTGVLTAYGISHMKGIIENLSNSQDVVYLGITGSQVTQAVSESEGIPTGVYVSSVESDSPALAAGIQAGDIITEINGNTISSLSDIREFLLLYSNGQVIQVNVMRLGKEEYKEIGCKVTLSVLR